MKEQVMVYEVKSSASANYNELFNPNGEFFYWNDKQFKNLVTNDYVYVVNSHNSRVLLTQVEQKGIETYFENEKTFFKDLDVDYEVSGKYDSFIRLRIIEDVTVPEDWKFKSLGSSETTYLNGERVNPESSANRLSNIESLEQVTEGELSKDILISSKANFSKDVLLVPILEAVNSPRIQSFINEEEFHYQLGVDKLAEFERFNELDKDELEAVGIAFTDSKQTYSDYIGELPQDSKEWRLFNLMGELISYCDNHAANKALLNNYEDKRTLGRSGVYQTNWINNLIAFKLNGHDYGQLSASIKNSLEYLRSPEQGCTMLSENHREMVSFFLFKEDNYDSASFIKKLILFFEPYDIECKNPLNKTFVISAILYQFEKVKELWYEYIEGLAATDGTGWLDSAISEIGDGKIVFWWNKKPTGGKKTIGLLRENIEQEKGHFYVYYLSNSFVTHRARVVDFADEKDYLSKKWNKNGDVSWYKENYQDYTDGTGTPNDKAKIVFLVDSIEKVENQISVDDFRFFKGVKAPVHNNLQPYVKVEFLERKVMSETNNKSKLSLNTILYGPPGTGKTYHTVNYALDVLGVDYSSVQSREAVLDLFNAKVKEGQILFTTFHQSMSYEDFIEGIKPITTKGNVEYEVKPGIFKAFCNDRPLFVRGDVFGKSKGEYTIEEITSDQVMIQRNSGLISFSLQFVNELVQSFLKGDINEEDFKPANRDKLREALPTKWDKYLFGFEAMLRELTTFVAGNLNNENRTNNPKVIIIDEINRGNVANIFGELITLIEDDKRIGKDNFSPVLLPYSNELFGVPQNIYIIGTMNTADRSVESLDSALRRRFSFVEMDPNPSILEEEKFKCEGIDIAKLLSAINDRIEILLDKDYCIGHSYFLGIKNRNDCLPELCDIFENKVIPLLQEYFYGDWGKIMLILGKAFVSSESPKTALLTSGLQDSYEEYEDKQVYRITKPGTWTLDYFKSIYE